jgi:hypothetical protein
MTVEQAVQYINKGLGKIGTEAEFYQLSIRLDLNIFEA